MRGNCGIVHCMETWKQLFLTRSQSHLVSLRISSITRASAAIERHSQAKAIGLSSPGMPPMFQPPAGAEAGLSPLEQRLQRIEELLEQIRENQKRLLPK